MPCPPNGFHVFKKTNSKAAGKAEPKQTLFGMLRLQAMRERQPVKGASRRAGAGWVRKRSFSTPASVVRARG